MILRQVDFLPAYFFNMEALKILAENTINLDIDSIMFEIVSEEEGFEELVIELNTERQLFEGIDSAGRELSSIGGDYSMLTVQIKKRKGQPSDRVTLRDTGDFYKSFKVIAQKDGFIIDADTVKEGIDLQDRWGEDIVGLTEMSKEALIFFLRPLLVIYVRDAMMKGVL